MIVLVTGATSQIGYFLLPMLVEADMVIHALSRRGVARECSGVRWVTGSMPDSFAPARNVQAIISCGPIDALGVWLEKHPLPALSRLVAISSMSAESKKASSVPTERAIAQRLREGEARLMRFCSGRGIAWTILRPTLIWGAGLDRSLSPIARRAARWRVFPFPDSAGIRQPVHAADVAEAVLRSLDNAESYGRVLPLGGGEQLTVACMFERVRKSLPVSTIPVALPRQVLGGLARVQPLLRGPLSRLETDLVADNTEIRRLLGISPRPFAPTAASWGLEQHASHPHAD